jgi:hypothetical protein
MKKKPKNPGRRSGLKAGKARAAKLAKEKRSESGREEAAKKWKEHSADTQMDVSPSSLTET